MNNRNSEQDRFIDSSFDQGDSLLNRSSPAEQSIRFGGLEKINPSLGRRVVPGQGGFRLADTPQAWVFIQKKEWLDDTWTYVINDPEITIKSDGQSKKVKLSTLSSDLEVAQADLTKIRQRLSFDLPSDRKNQLTIEEQNKQKQIKQLQSDISAAEQVAAQTGSSSQVPGKVTQIDIRSALANIITRKLDLISDHEKFTKVTASYNQSVEAIQLKRQGQAIKAVQDSYQSIDKEIAKLDENILTLEKQNTKLQQEIQSLEQASQNIDKLMVEEWRKNPLPPNIQEILTKLNSDKKEIDQEIVLRKNYVQGNQQRIQELEKRRAETTAKAQNSSLDSYDTDTVQLYTPTTFSGNAYTRYYKSPIVKNVSNAQARQLRAQLSQTLVQLTEQSNTLIQQTRTGRVGAQEQLLQTQLEYADTRRQLDKLNTRLAAQQLDAPVAVEVGKETFNGVIELANVSQITTSVNIEGEGSANFTIENPQNLFFISQDDVDLALSEDPFLEATKTLDGMVYYRGRFYPPQIVDMLLRRKGYTTGLLNTKQALATQIAGQISDITKQIRAIDAQLAASRTLMNDSDVQQFTSKKASLQADLTELQKQQDNLNNSLSARTQQQVNQDTASSNQETQKKQDNMSLIRQTLVKYYVSKTILQVLDRVYIWMTSPTRTIFRLNRQDPDRFGLEDPSAVVMGRQIRSIEEKIQLIQGEFKRLLDFFRTTVTSPDRLKLQDLKNSAVLAALVPLSPNLGKLKFKPNSNLLSYVEGGPELTFEQTKTYAIRLTSELPILEETKRVVQKNAASTDTMTGARTLDKLPFSQGLGRDSQQQRQIINNYESRYQGIEEERLQVFQGIISTVKQTYSDGKYQIHVSCRDNLVFLSMSRIMIKPALRADQGPRGLLQDPIWRGNELAGNWKNGIVVLDFAFVNDEVRARMDRNITIDAGVQSNLLKKKVLSEKEAKEGGVTPFVTSLPFAKIDAADLVSFVITGFPYNFGLFLKNAAFGGRTTFQRTDGTTDQRSEGTSFFAFLKRRVGELNDRLGDFEPFIDLGGNQFDDKVFKERKDQLTSARGMALKDLEDAYIAYISNRMQRFLLRLQERKRGPTFINAEGFLDAVEQALQPLLSQDVLKKQIDIAQHYTNKNQFSLFVDQGTSFVLNILAKIVTDAATNNNSFQAGPNQASTAVGTQLGTESNFENIATIITQSLSKGTQIGAFQVIANLAIEEAKVVEKSSKNGGVRTGSSQATGSGVPGTSNESTDVIAQKALIPFVRSLLIVQAGFSQEYVSASIASTNLASLTRIEPELHEYLEDIRSQSASVQADIKDGPQSTLEKIVRAEKKNFLIISDQYELDFDLQAYQTQIGQDFALWQSEWETPLSICRRAAEQVDFEFYADENGNIQFKPPTYNRILKEHFPLISETDRNVRNAILIRYGGTYGQVLRVVLRAVALLNQTKVEFSSKRLSAVNALELSRAAQRKRGSIPTQGDVAGDSTNSTTQSLQYAKSEEITSAYQELVDQTVQQIKDGSTVCDRSAWVPISASIQAEQEAQKNIRLLHTTEDRGLTDINIDLESQKEEDDVFHLGQDKNDANTQLQQLEEKLKNAEEADPQNPQLISELQTAIVNTNSELARIQAKINDKSYTADQRKLKKKVDLYTTLNRQIDSLLIQANDTRERVRQQAKSFVDGLERFTDECRIHRIADYDMISYELTEAPPRFTYLEVTGAPELVQITPAEYYWAGGVDYDNWRQYGYISENMQKAYFHSGDQARTYIRAMLGRERGRIFTASTSVRGDSKFRVGDCVFVECLGMYFYILSVSQSLTYGGSYTTNLALSYGRRVGEIIPHPFDALGKIMIETYQNDVEELLARQQFAKQQQGKSNKQT